MSRKSKYPTLVKLCRAYAVDNGIIFNVDKVKWPANADELERLANTMNEAAGEMDDFIGGEVTEVEVMIERLNLQPLDLWFNELIETDFDVFTTRYQPPFKEKVNE